MQEKRFTYLFERFYYKEYSAIEREAFLHMVASGRYDQQLAEMVDLKFKTFEPQEDLFSPEVESKILRTVLDSRTPVNQKGNSPSKQGKLWVRIAQVAAVLMMTSMGIFYYSADKKHPTGKVVYKNDVTPGRLGATLTLSNGKKISLNQQTIGEIARHTGISIIKSEKGRLIYRITGSENRRTELNTLCTQSGETYQVELPDGTQVWLNAASSITYSTNMHREKNRLVNLQGEAYFEVAKDKAHPFIVKSLGQRIEVLGTHFNINAYPGERYKTTTLLEGSIKISEGENQEVLKPGSQASNSGKNIVVQNVDTKLSVGWKDGKFIFERQKIDHIMKMVERWYNVQIIYSGEIPEDVFAGSVSRFDNLSHVLNVLESTGRVHFRMDGRRVYVFK